ncbi:hypothetical protein Fcan01_18104 [Folsomia candida]|uniref:Uncharacterized protein n=1 Tax=Folsomia candida TaxID=158441 RepID=A0A226DQR2_FOLCA|nr:hypothetical protein Fcan01_18104 [Folsomia candida]
MAGRQIWSFSETQALTKELLNQGRLFAPTGEIDIGPFANNKFLSNRSPIQIKKKITTLRENPLMWSRYMTLDQLLSVKHNETRPYLILRSILTARVERERVGLTTRKQLPPAPPPPPPPPPPQAIKPIRLDHGSSPLQHNLDSRPLSRGNITTQKWTRKETEFDKRAV